jgi:hypothetical protein
VGRGSPAGTGNTDSPEVVCAWCGRVIARGRPGEVSHGLCEECVPIVLAEIELRLAHPDGPKTPPATEPGFSPDPG